jgi:hypothetical protein
MSLLKTFTYRGHTCTIATIEYRDESWPKEQKNSFKSVVRLVKSDDDDGKQDGNPIQFTLQEYGEDVAPDHLVACQKKWVRAFDGIGTIDNVVKEVIRHTFSLPLASLLPRNARKLEWIERNRMWSEYVTAKTAVLSSTLTTVAGH